MQITSFFQIPVLVAVIAQIIKLYSRYQIVLNG